MSEKNSLEKFNNDKTVEASAVIEDEGFSHSGHVAPKYLGSIIDQHDMRALGKVQVLRVRGHNMI